MDPIWQSGAFHGPRRAAWFITGRHGGFSSGPWESLNLGPHVGDEAADVTRNREFVQTLVNADDIVWATLEHGAQVARVSKAGSSPTADALLTDVPGLAIAITAADCVPIALGAPGMVAVVHSGWRGLLTGVVPATIAAMRDAGADRLEAVVGPGICGACYPVDRSRRDELVAALDPTVAAVACSPEADSSPWIDVAAGVRAQLDANPVVESVIDVSACTRESADLYSFRRDGQTGRHAMIAVLGHE